MVQMSEISETYNFAAGPATLPQVVKEQLSRDMLDFRGQGISIGEQGHRTEVFSEIRDQLKGCLQSLLGIPDNHQIIFLQGGARMQFAMPLLNYCHQGHKPAYIETGHWGYRGTVEASSGEYDPQVLWTDRPAGYRNIPEKLLIQKKYAFVHMVGNETIHGVQIPTNPDEFIEDHGDNWYSIDCSSDLLSRPMDCSKFGLIYACAQKNLGIVGNTVLIIRDDILDQAHDKLPPILSYKNLFKLDSIYNTAPVMAIYTSLLMCQWIQDKFGTLDKVASYNQQKADLLYGILAKYPEFYLPHASAAAQSHMNVVMKFADDSLQAEFLKICRDHNMINLKGHRELGGIRVSNYNAVPLAGVQKLCELLEDFAKKKA